MLKLQANGTISNLPVVIKHVQKPNAGTMQNAIITTYKYDSINPNDHDYLAFGSVKQAIPNSTQDVLFNTNNNYTYKTLTDNGQIQDIKTYNKYHLMIDNIKIDDQTNQRLSEMQNYYCNPNVLNACNALTFAQLPAFYTLPLKVVQKVWSRFAPTAKPMELVSQATYDDEGNALTIIDHYGRTSQITYCPIKGDAACPADPTGWPFINLIQSTVYTSAPTHHLGVTYHDDPLLNKTDTSIILRNLYEKVPTRLGKNYFLKIKEKHISFGAKTVSTRYDYFLNPHDARTYGMPKKEYILNSPTKTALFSGTHTFGINEITMNLEYPKTKINLMTSTGTITNPLIPNQILHLLPITIRSAYTGKVLEKIAPDQTSSTTYDYDRWKRLIAINIYEGRAGTSHAKLVRTTKTYYTVSPDLNEKIIVNADGSQEKFMYDGLDRPIATYGQALHNGHLLPIINENGTTHADGWQLLSTHTYNQYGHLVDIKNYVGLDAHNQPIVLDTHKYYNARGQPIRITHTDGTTVHYLYAENELCTARYITDKKSHMSQVTIANFNHIKKMIRSVTYPQGVVIPNQDNIAQLCQLDNNVNHKGLISTYLYDGFGRLRQIMDPEGHKLTKIYDAQGHLTDIIDPKGNKTHYTYNMLGKIISKTLEPVTGGAYPMAVYKYNVMGQRIEKFIEGAIGPHSTLHPFYRYTYNSRGLLTQMTTPNHHVFTQHYDALNHLIEQDINGQLNIKFFYNKYGQMIRRVDSSGTYRVSYNPMGAMTSVQHQGNAQYPSYTLHWRYNDYGQLIAKTDINGNVSYTTLDALGRLSSLYYVAHNHSSPQLIQHVQYDTFDRPTTLVDGNGLTRNLTYNPLGRIQKIQDTLDNHGAYAWNMTYDSLGNIVKKNTTDGHGDHSIKKYQYDTLSNLTDFACTSSSATNLCPRDTDRAHSELTVPTIIAHQHYTFTALNALSSVHEKLYTLKYATHILNKLTRYHYNSEAYGPLRLKNYSVQWGTQAPITSGTFVYDNDGNMVIDGKGDHMTYNATNQILSDTNAQGKTFHYTYDGLKREISEQYNGITNTLFYNPSGHRLNERRTQGAITHTVGYFGVMETIDSAPSQYLESDYKGDVTQVWGASSAGHHILTTNVYSPYGMTYDLLKNTVAPLIKNAIGFDGQRTDPGTKWQMLGNGHRAYNPVLRHFMTEDPILEGYTFGSNNPIMNIDPSGNMSKSLMTFMKYFNIAGTALFNPYLGIAIGITTIESQKHPHNHSWNTAAKAMSITNSLIMATAGVIVFFVPLIGAEVSVAITSLVVCSLILSTVSTLANIAAAGVGVAATVTNGEVSNILSYVSLGLQCIAIVSGLLAQTSVLGIKARLYSSKVTNFTPDLQLTASADFDGLQACLHDEAISPPENPDLGEITSAAGANVVATSPVEATGIDEEVTPAITHTRFFGFAATRDAISSTVGADDHYNTAIIYSNIQHLLEDTNSRQIEVTLLKFENLRSEAGKVVQILKVNEMGHIIKARVLFQSNNIVKTLTTSRGNLKTTSAIHIATNFPEPQNDNSPLSPSLLNSNVTG